jgi:hypothetical protein
MFPVAYIGRKSSTGSAPPPAVSLIEKETVPLWRRSYEELRLNTVAFVENLKRAFFTIE